MYTAENKNSFSFKNVILQFLFVALFIFIMIWLFPLKSDLKRVENKLESTQTDFSVLYDRIFNENVIAMKDGAKSYFTTSRLPKNVGDKVKMTLREMLNAKIVLPFTDKNGDVCDEEASYVEITKYEDEYVMKVNLKCGEQENYLLVYMGCYDYCSTTICEKNPSDVTTPIIYPVQPVVPDIDIDIDIDNNNNITIIVPPTPTPEPDPIPEPTPIYKTRYEYKKVIAESYSEWSEWSTEIPESKDTREIQFRTVESKVLIGYNRVTSDDYSKPIFGTVDAVVGQVTKTYCESYDYVATGEVVYTDWQYQYTASFKTAPVSTETVKYEKVGDYNWYCEDDCSSGTVFLYKVYTRTPANVATYECTSTKTVPTAVVAQKTVITGYEQKASMEPVYETRTRTEYRYRDIINKQSEDTKWSNTDNDTELLSQGYVLTGNVRTEIVLYK